MKVLFKSFYLFFLGAAADVIRWSLEREIRKSAGNGRSISSKKLSVLSDLSYFFYSHFLRLETDLRKTIKFL